MNSQTKQRGAATILTTVILLIGITLVTLLTAKTVLVETQIAADNYRTGQAVAAANAAMDYGVTYFDDGGFDHNGDTAVDTIAEQTYTATDGKVSYGQLQFLNTGSRCDPPSGPPAATDMRSGEIIATGLSDDRLATRRISQCVGPLDVLRDDGPKQPLVTQSQVALTGNARIINRYTNTTIWSGGKVVIGSSSAMETWIKDPAVTSALTTAQLIDTDDSHNAIMVSNKNLGNGLDIIDDDPSLDTLVGVDFFKNFFKVDSRAELKNLAKVYSSIGDAAADTGTDSVNSGLIWVDGDQAMRGGTIGSTDKPAIVIIDGDFDISGGPTIYGLVYIIGKYAVTGTATIIGSNIVEGTEVTIDPTTGARTETPATPPIVTGHGTLSLVYWAGFASSGPNPLDGLTAVISGSWRDW